MHALGRLQVLTERQCPQDELLPSQKSVAAGMACGESTDIDGDARKALAVAFRFHFLTLIALGLPPASLVEGESGVRRVGAWGTTRPAGPRTEQPV